MIGFVIILVGVKLYGGCWWILNYGNFILNLIYFDGENDFIESEENRFNDCYNDS